MTDSAGGDGSHSSDSGSSGNPPTGSSGGVSSSTGDKIDSARQELLEESRTTLSEQLGQINKIDDAAVRTVRISLLILGILAGGPTLVPFPDLGLAGAVGTVALVLTLVGAITVYGTSRVFIGSAPDELAVDYTQVPIVENTYVEILSEYDDGLSDNRSTLRANGFILAISRTLLVISIIAILYGLINNGTAGPSEAINNSTSGALTLIMLQW